MIFSLAITGPTASGKTALSLSLAERLSCEIICCDSMQIYREMDIGTAKATPDERARVPHHMLDFLSPTESYSAESYRTSAIECAREITSRGKIPLFVGGTGLYIDSVKRGATLTAPESDPEYRDAILAGIRDDADVEALWQRLLLVDPESAEKTHKNNIKRVIRALEIYDKTGIPKSRLDRESKNASPEIFVGMITLDFHNRELLYDRADRRVNMMLKEGLLEEAESLYRRGLLAGTAAQAIGYKELKDFIEGKCTLDEATEELKLATRRYAKRQLTWFRREENAQVIFADTPDGEMRSEEEMLDEATMICRGFLTQFNEMKGR